jgi:hypothetical protein
LLETELLPLRAKLNSPDLLTKAGAVCIYHL